MTRERANSERVVISRRNAYDKLERRQTRVVENQKQNRHFRYFRVEIRPKICKCCTRPTRAHGSSFSVLVTITDFGTAWFDINTFHAFNVDNLLIMSFSNIKRESGVHETGVEKHMVLKILAL